MVSLRVSSSVLIASGLLIAACSSNQPGIQATVDAKVAAAVATLQARPTATPQPTTTPQPTPTPQTLPALLQPTPQPTATPMTLPPFPTPLPTATPVTFPPTPTPMVFPPTPTPIAFPPTATPQPTATPFPLPATIAAPAWDAVLQEVRRSVVRVNSPSGPLLGSGIYLGDGLILTQEHVVRGFVNLQVTADLGRASGTATIRGTNTTKDIALLRLVDRTWTLPALALRPTSQNETGREVALIGYPLFTDDSPSISRGIISRYVHLGDLGWVIETDAAYNPGVNGGPLVDRDGNVVGIMQTTPSARQQGLAWCETSDEVIPLLDALKGGSRT